MLMAVAVNNAAAKTPGKESVAMEAFAKALQQLPTTIADNAGFDSAQLVAELRASHVSGNTFSGLDMDNGRVACMKTLGITESFVVKRQVILIIDYKLINIFVFSCKITIYDFIIILSNFCNN